MFSSNRLRAREGLMIEIVLIYSPLGIYFCSPSSQISCFQIAQLKWRETESTSPSINCCKRWQFGVLNRDLLLMEAATRKESRLGAMVLNQDLSWLFKQLPFVVAFLAPNDLHHLGDCRKEIFSKVAKVVFLMILMDSPDFCSSLAPATQTTQQTSIVAAMEMKRQGLVIPFPV